VESSGRYFFGQMTYGIVGGRCIGLILPLNGGIPAKACHHTHLFAACAAITVFMRRVSEGSDAAGLSYVSLAAAAAPLRSQAGRPSGREKRILAPTSAPNGGCFSWIPGELRAAPA
jgi:hypothetical protein